MWPFERSKTATDRPPHEEMAERFAEAEPGLLTAAQAVGLQDHQRMLTDYRNRLLDGHKAQARAVGFPLDQISDNAGTSAGSIIITGDVSHQHQTMQKRGVAGPLAGALVGAMLLAGGSALGVLASKWLTPAVSMPKPADPKDVDVTARMEYTPPSSGGNNSARSP